MTDIIHELEAEIVGVHVVEDKRPESKRYLRTTLKSYTIDNVNVPIMQIAPYNPRRSHLVVTTNDFGVIITQDNPSPNAQTDNASNPPQGASIHLGTMGVGFKGYTIYGPDPVWVVSVQGQAATRVSVLQHIWCYDD